jgi:hypothetical protein
MAVEMPDRLTKKQRELLEELKEISSIVRVDYWNIKDRERPARTAVLEVMKRELIRGEVVGQYTLIDDILSTELCKYFLSSKDMIKQWRTKKFKRFNYYVIERLYMTQKLAFLKDLYQIPKPIAEKIEGINALRNALAHAFFPENLRAYQVRGRPAPRKPIVVRYKGQSLFSTEGVQAFVEDCAEVTNFLLGRLRRRANADVAFLL